MNNQLQHANNLTLPAPVLIVEDDRLMQKRLRGLMHELGYTDEALVFASGVIQASTYLEEQPFAMALVDLGLPDGNGIDLICKLRHLDPAVSILVISAWSTEEVILKALKAGANGYVLKERDDLEVILSIRSTLRGGAPIDPFVARHILSLIDTTPQTQSDAPQLAIAADTQTDIASTPAAIVLSQREQEILHLVADGQTNQEIAENLYISKFTVECHVKNIYRKLSVSSRTKAINEARLRGLIL